MSANGPFAQSPPHTAINIFMLTAPIILVPVNRLTFNVLRNALFGIAKRAVLASETGHIAAQNRPFCGIGMSQGEIRLPQNVF